MKTNFFAYFTAYKTLNLLNSQRPSNSIKNPTNA
jgi:hypothetical protein